MKAQKLFRIKAPILKLKTKGYVNLITRNRVEVGGKRKAKVVIYKSKKDMLTARENYQHKKNVQFNKSFAKASFIESAVNMAKNAIKEAKGHILSTIEHFALHCNLLKAYKHLNSFKYSLPKLIRINLF